MARTPAARPEKPEPITPEEALIPRVVQLDSTDPDYDSCVAYPFAMIMRDKDGYIVREDLEEGEVIARPKLVPNKRWFFKILPTKPYGVTLGAQTA
ncbi:MAG: hypothetical protein ACRETL_06705, partial [Gammaproteobacteria bacterium]